MRNTISLDICENYIADSILHNDEDIGNQARIKRLLSLVKKVVAEELTPKQRLMCSMYYFDRIDMTTIAETLGVNKSTVSRTIARGLRRVNERLKYYRFR